MSPQQSSHIGQSYDVGQPSVLRLICSNYSPGQVRSANTANTVFVSVLWWRDRDLAGDLPGDHPHLSSLEEREEIVVRF